MEPVFFTDFTEIYNCKTCDIICSRQSEWNRHLLTRKHQKRQFGSNFPENFTAPKEYKCKCGRNYTTHGGLWKHKKICIDKEPVVENLTEIQENELKKITNLMIEMVKNNSDLKQQNQDFQKQIMEMCKNNSININSHNNSHNKTFNLQFFLNEQCKDAMNLMDFVKSFSLQLSDLENVSKLGYVEGITGIIVKKLNEMDVHKRPIHCSDAKREILYVREDNIWEKDDENNTKLRKAIKYISKKNRGLLSEWSESHPESNDLHSNVNTEYMLMIIQAMGGKGELVDNENKIMKKIMKHVLIDK